MNLVSSGKAKQRAQSYSPDRRQKKLTRLTQYQRRVLTVPSLAPFGEDPYRPGSWRTHTMEVRDRPANKFERLAKERFGAHDVPRASTITYGGV